MIARSSDFPFHDALYRHSNREKSEGLRIASANIKREQECRYESDEKRSKEKKSLR